MSGHFAHEFLDDYFLEAEEHLSELRRSLLALEDNPAGWTPDQLKDVRRSLHTLKGLSGMVGFEEVERAAHALEEVVRFPEGSSQADAVPLLFEGVHFLERALAARRAGHAPEDPSALVEKVVHTAEEVPPVAARAGRHLELRFAPTPDLVARGLGVEAVRERLRALGTIRSVSPRMQPGGEGVVFHFDVELAPDVKPDPAWRELGISWSDDDEGERGPRPATTPLGAPASGAAPANVVRVDLGRLDELMRLVGELVVSRARLEDSLGTLESGSMDGTVTTLRDTAETMERQIRSLREGVMRVRLVPVGDTFERLRFAIRDAARETGKDVVVDVVGADTEIDRLVVDRMMEPLLHLVRNAVSHGLEDGATRAGHGKPRQGRIVLRAAASGDRIRIEVEDDGAGVDRELVLRRAEERGLAVAGRVDDARILDLLCAPGLSTRAEPDRTSGRGVGMDVVRATVRALNGELSMQSEPGRGTRFAIEMPLTLMIVDALLVRVGGQTMAVPQPVLREVLKVDASAVTPMGGGEIISYRGGVLPIIRLARVFGMERGEAPASMHVLVVGDDADRVGLAVEELAGLREIVVHPVDDPLVATPGVSGATELTDGRLGLILDAAALTREAREAPRRAQRARVEA